MSKNGKILLIIGGILTGLAIICVGGIFFFGYYFVDHEGISKSSDEGREFGKATDSSGCQTKIVPMLKSVRETDVNEIVKVRYFFRSCLETSSFTPKFCDGVPSDWKDIMNDDKAKEAECQKLGFKDFNACRQVMKEKLDFCDTKR